MALTSLEAKALLATATADELRAFAELVLVVAYADGTYSEAERSRFGGLLAALSSGKIGDSSLDELLEQSGKKSQLTGEERATRLRQLSPQLGRTGMREAAFQVALEVAFADGGLGVREGSSLAACALELGLSSESALELLRIAGARQA